MQTTKLAEILNCFSTEEWNRFRHFLDLRYLRVSQKQKKIYDYIKEYNFREKKKPTKKGLLFPSKARLCKKFFSASQCKNFDLLTRNLSVLHQHTRSFLASERVRNEERELELTNIQKALGSRQHNYAKLAINRNWNEIKEETHDWYIRYVFVQAMSNLYIQLNNNPLRTTSLLLKDETLDDYYLIERLRNYCLQLVHQYLDKNFQIPLYQQSFEVYLDAYMKRKAYLPAIFRAYYFLFKIFQRQEEEEGLEKLREIFMEEQEKIPENYLDEIQTFLLNHYAILTNKGQKKHLDLLGIYQIFLHADMLKKKDGYIPVLQYKSLVILAVQANAYQWLKNELIKKTIKQVPPDYQKIAANHAYSEYHFGIKNWKEAFDFAFDIPSNNKIYKFSRGTLLIRTAYELEQIGFVETETHVDNTESKYSYHKQIQNFASQIRNNQSLDYRIKNRYLNFVSFNRKLYRLGGNNENSEMASEVLQELEKEKNIANKAWLRQRIELYVS